MGNMLLSSDLGLYMTIEFLKQFDHISQDIIQAMPHDAHPMGVLVSAMSALSVFHPDANPALRVSYFIYFRYRVLTTLFQFNML